MSIRLPIPGKDNGTWGTILNNFLEVSHNSDGSLKIGSDVSRALSNSNLAVKKVNGVGPDSSGNVSVSTGASFARSFLLMGG